MYVIQLSTSTTPSPLRHNHKYSTDSNSHPRCIQDKHEQGFHTTAYLIGRSRVEAHYYTSHTFDLRRREALIHLEAQEVVGLVVGTQSSTPHHRVQSPHHLNPPKVGGWTCWKTENQVYMPIHIKYLQFLVCITREILQSSHHTTAIQQSARWSGIRKIKYTQAFRLQKGQKSSISIPSKQ